MLAEGRDQLVPLLLELGVEAVPDAFEFLAPPKQRPPAAALLASQLVLLPLHPFYGPKDIDVIAEALRRATVRSANLIDAN
jgi:dTDP-4-amino-4,6-dideoxygalactose transaminase